MKNKVIFLTAIVFVSITVLVAAEQQSKSILVAATQISMTQLKPDITVEKITVTAKEGGELIDGKDAAITCYVKNKGGDFTGEYHIAIFVDGSAIGSPIGSTATPDVTSLMTPWTAIGGKHIAKCIVDTQNVIPEFNESNNELSYRFQVKQRFILSPAGKDIVKQKTDISVEKIEVKADDGGAVVDGKPSRIYCHWKRNGSMPEADFRLYIGIDGKPLTLAQGDTVNHTMEASWLSTPWVAQAGQHQIKCEADPANEVNETNEKNNKMILLYQLKEALVPTRFDTSIMKRRTDLSIQKLEVKVDDGGVLTIGKPSHIYCHWKRTGAMPEADFRLYIGIDGKPLTLAQGDTVNHTMEVSWLSTPWVAQAGQHQIKCEIDPANEVIETNENNNKIIHTINLNQGLQNEKTDVLIDKIEVQAEDKGALYGGKDARIYCFWKRTGAEPKFDFRVATFVDGVPIGLPQGSTVQHNLMSGWLGTPWKASSGTHLFKCIADSAYEIAEDNEVNNTKILKITVSPPPPAK